MITVVSATPLLLLEIVRIFPERVWVKEVGELIRIQYWSVGVCF